jgi:predicted nucleic acid-binding Zn ribbon protein
MAGQNDTLPIGDIVKKVILGLSEDSAKRQRISEEEIKGLWRKAAGSFASRKSHPTSLRKGKLIVAVDNSSVLYDLTLRKREALKLLTEVSGGRVTEIQFRIGETGGESKSEKRKTKSEKRN